ncbi:MAG: hypothetical protein VW741_02535 [Flammeovirgaceae bacterium]
MITLYGTFLVNESNEIQYDLYTDLDTGNYREETTARFDNFNMEFPKLSVSAIPIKTLVAQYYILGDRYNEALELLNESKEYNPYIMYNEMTKINVFTALQMRDSAYFYSELAFSQLPNNQKHFIELARSYVSTDKYHKLDSIFKIVKSKALPDIWKYYFSSLLTDEEKISDYGYEQAKEAIDKFSNRPDIYKELLLSANYVLMGMESVNKALDLEDQATSEYNNSNFRIAAELYEQASELNPINSDLFENSGISYFQDADYENALRILSKVTDSLSKINPKTGKSEFIMSQSYYNLGDIIKACDYAYKSSSYDYRDAFKLIALYCSKENKKSNVE